jgi:hypothetical protein
MEWDDPVHKNWTGGGLLDLINPNGNREILSYFTEVLLGKP